LTNAGVKGAKAAIAGVMMLAPLLRAKCGC